MSERFEMRLETEMLELIDGWRGSQGDLPSRAEAVRRLVNAGLGKGTEFTISDGDRLIISLLSDLMKHAQVDTDLDMELIQELISSGQLWALNEVYPGLFAANRYTDSRSCASAPALR
jgi:hypothetical protein